jgi:hypothetical protein
MESVFVTECGVIHKIPPDDGVYVLSSKPKLHEALSKLCLQLLVLGIMSVGGEGNFRNGNGETEIAIAIEYVKETEWVADVAALTILRVLIAQGVELHTDALDGSAFLQSFLDCHVIIASESAILGFAKGFKHALVPIQRGVRKMLFADVKAPFFVVAIVCDLKITAAEALIAVFVDAIHLIDDVYVVEGGGVTLRDCLQASIDLDFDLAAILGKPLGLEGVINEAMSLHAQMVILAKFYDGIHGRASVNMDGIL